jgi:hypothetical protein
MEQWKRIGVALTAPRGANQRRNEYGVYRSPAIAYGYPVPQTLHVKYEGYRVQRADGEAQVGLPLAGPNAGYLQPLVAFHARDFETVRYFEV